MNFNSKFPRELLNEIKYRGYNLSSVTVFYTNRGSPNDLASVSGDRIWKIDRGFLVLSGIPYETYIPYHRIRKITFNNETIFER